MAPLGQNGELLHVWAFKTEAFKQWHGQNGGSIGIDNDFIERGFSNIGATIMGRNMFGPIRGAWPNAQWRGWWGENHEIWATGPCSTSLLVESALLDELHVARIPVTLKAGEKLFSDETLQMKSYRPLPEVISETVIHQKFMRV